MTAISNSFRGTDGREPILRADRRPYFPPRRIVGSIPETNLVPRPIVALDIDGTLGLYHEHFLGFAEGWLGRNLPDASDYEGGSLARFMGVSKARYRDCKLAYRQGGLKRNMPVYPGAADLSKSVRSQGGEIWVCTTRPYLRLDNIDPDTREWLRRNKISWDGVLYGERKYHDLSRIIDTSRVIGVLDDLVEMALQARNCGMPAVIRAQPYNASRAIQEGLPVVSSLQLAEFLFTNRIKEYKEKNGLPPRAC